jgi:hypothetical protein
MKTFCKTILITGFILISINGILAQTTDNRLNQVDLMKQFIGSWKCELPGSHRQIPGNLLLLILAMPLSDSNLNSKAMI